MSTDDTVAADAVADPGNGGRRGKRRPPSVSAVSSVAVKFTVPLELVVAVVAEICEAPLPCESPTTLPGEG